MAASGLLFLLLSSTLLFCSLSQPLSPVKRPASNSKDQPHRLQRRGVLTTTHYALKIVEATSPVIELIPIAGPIISSIIKLGKAVLDEKTDPTKTLLNELKSLESQLEKYRGQLKWDVWASHYATYETDINAGWKLFQDLMKDLTDKSKEKENLINNFKKLFSKIALATSKLHQVLTDKTTVFAPKFQKLVSETFTCHENEIKKLTVLINGLVYKGNTVKYYYDGLVSVDGINTLVNDAFDCAKAMFEIHKKCIDKSLDYIKQDVKNLIVNSKSSEREQLARQIRLFLESNYDRYNWIVVVFITSKSKHEHAAILNKHILSGFIEVPVGEVTAAVARQLKGDNKQANKVTKAIDKCFEKSLVDCKEVKSALDKCGKSDGIDLSQAYTSIHAYLDKSHESNNALNAKEAPEEYIGADTSSTLPYVYYGKCKKYKIFSTGKFRVLIKSDEEMAGKSPCEKMQCNTGKGKCELLDDKKVPVCICEEGFYGEHCEESVEAYKENLKKSRQQ